MDGASSPDEPRARELLSHELAWPLAGETLARHQRPVTVRTYELPLYVRLEVNLSIDPEKWHAGFLSVRERELPAEIFTDLRELSPQAVLRDLYRPVREFFVTPEAVEGTDVRDLLPRTFRELRRARVLESRPQVESLTRAVREAQRQRRAFLASPWQPAKPDDAPRDQPRSS